MPTITKQALPYVRRMILTYWRHGAWHKLLVIMIGFGLVLLGAMYGIARWYMTTTADKPYVYGASFIPAYAESLGLDPQETMDALLNDVGVRHFRLVSYWEQLEATEGQYDFSLLDWQFQKAEATGAKVTLSLGLRQPRWPECHMPQWAAGKPVEQWQPQLEAFMTAVVNRYKASPALDSYQVENEFFLKGFGICEAIPHSMDRQRLVAEYQLVKRLDPHHTAIINRSNNGIGWPVGEPQPDEFGISIYKRAWGNPPGRYVEYPFPAWYYAFVAGWQKLMTGRDMIIHELQTEAWAPNNKFITEVDLAEQNKSFNAERLKKQVAFGRGTGMHEMYLWGAEYWYYRKVHEHDNTVWEIAKDIYHKQHNTQ